uniref:Uncharacterized protein n=1 Tax=Anguilla anguilla TaxID=7936 RepID=A0A0E9UWL0_ANGAN
MRSLKLHTKLASSQLVLITRFENIKLQELS